MSANRVTSIQLRCAQIAQRFVCALMRSHFVYRPGQVFAFVAYFMQNPVSNVDRCSEVHRFKMRNTRAHNQWCCWCCCCCCRWLHFCFGNANTHIHTLAASLNIQFCSSAVAVPNGSARTRNPHLIPNGGTAETPVTTHIHTVTDGMCAEFCRMEKLQITTV